MSLPLMFGQRHQVPFQKNENCLLLESCDMVEEVFDGRLFHPLYF